MPDIPSKTTVAERKAATQDDTQSGATGRRLEQLPAYAKTLLQVNVSVEVTLAEKEMPISEIVNLVPGSIIQFDKSCEEMLEVSVGNVRVAEGDAVKVGDKFGLRVTSICLPSERYRQLRP